MQRKRGGILQQIGNEVSADAFQGDLDLGAFLGRQQAFGFISGRCSAAQAACLREIHEKKLYKDRCPDWGKFCNEYLHMSRTQVEKIIALLNEFGPEYFELSQLTRVSAGTFRAIRPALQDGVMHIEGEPIALIPANAARISAAVAGLRKAAIPKGQMQAVELSHKERVSALERRCSEIVAEFESLAGSAKVRHDLAAVLVGLQRRLDRLESQL
jgi:hypothetical protein